MKKLGIGFGLLLSFSQLYSPYSWGQEVWRIEQSIGKMATKIGGDEQQISLDLPLLGTLELGDSIDLDIPGEGFVPAIVDSKHKNQNGSFSLRARMQKHSGALILTYDLKSAYGYLEYGDEVYKLKGDKSGGQIKKRVANAFAEPELTRFMPDTHDIISASKKAQSAAALQKAATSDEIAELDILVVYTAEATEFHGDETLTRINQIFAMTNFLLEASGVKIKVNLVHAEAVGFVESASAPTTVLGAISSGTTGIWLNVHNLRYEYGADIVALLTRQFGGGSKLCGTHGTTIGCEDSRYIRVGIGANLGNNFGNEDFVFAHELGHSLGLNHSRLQGDVGATFPFALGYLYPDLKGTIMSYNDFNLGRFSNPEIVNPLRTSTGIDKSFKNGADAVYALNAIRFEAAEGYHQEPDLTLAADLIAQRGNTALADCVRNGPKKYVRVIDTLDCSNASIQSLAGLELLQELVDLNLSSNSIIDLSGFPILPKLRILDLSDNEIEDFSPVIELPSLSELNLEGNEVSEISDLLSLEKSLESRVSFTLLLANNPLQDITHLLHFYERGAFPVHYDLYGNDDIYCWQKQHLLESFFALSGESLLDALTNGIDIQNLPITPCDDSQDEQDFNGNGVSNAQDLVNDNNPFLAEFSSALDFSETVFEVNEDEPKGRITIERTGSDLNGDVNFWLVTQQGFKQTGEEDPLPQSQAIRDFDFLSQNQQYTLAAGEPQMFIDIDIIDDEWYYGDAQFQITLYGPEGAGLGSEHEATVAIVDDEGYKMTDFDETQMISPPVANSVIVAVTPLPSTDATPASSGGSGGGGALGQYWLLLLFILFQQKLVSRYISIRGN